MLCIGITEPIKCYVQSNLALRSPHECSHITIAVTLGQSHFFCNKIVQEISPVNMFTSLFRSLPRVTWIVKFHCICVERLAMNEHWLVSRPCTNVVRSRILMSRSPSWWSDDRCSTSFICSSPVCCSQPSDWWRSVCHQRAVRKSVSQSQCCLLWHSSCLWSWRISHLHPRWCHSLVSMSLTQRHTLCMDGITFENAFYCSYNLKNDASMWKNKTGLIHVPLFTQ